MVSNTPYRRLLDAPPFALAAVVTVVAVVGSYGEAHPSSSVRPVFAGHALPHVPAAAFLLPASAALALMLRRSWPLLVAAFSAACVLAYTSFGYPNGAALVAPVVALYTLGVSHSPRRALGWGLAVAAALTAATAATSPFGPTGGGFPLVPVELLVALLAGLAVASRRDYLLAMHLHAQERQIDEERVRIARELHDSLAHTMATITVQASTAVHLAGERADPAVHALKTIKEASKDGLNDLRTILGVLRETNTMQTRQPLPTLAELRPLIERTKRAGVDTKVQVAGVAIALPTSTEAAAFRIIQESLANVIRHSGSSIAHVSIAYHPGSLEVEVRDSGTSRRPKPQPAGPGYGIRGMRERTTALGGRFEAGPHPEGGFCVRATLPLSACDVDLGERS